VRASYVKHNPDTCGNLPFAARSPPELVIAKSVEYFVAASER
jgi:hypothetical protein